MQGLVSRIGGLIRLEGYIDNETGNTLIRLVEEALKEDEQQITLSICSAGGLTGKTFGVISQVRELLTKYGSLDRPIPLWTFGLEDVSSSAILLFSSGDKRILHRQAKMRFHECTLLFKTLGEGTTQREIREAIAEIYKKGCVSKGQKAVSLLQEFSTSKFAAGGGLTTQMQACALIASRIDEGDERSCEWTNTVVEFLEAHLQAAGENDVEFADLVGRKSGLTAGVIRGFMLTEQIFDSEAAVAIGLADEVM